MPLAPSVLVIDDDHDFRSVVCDELAHAGYAVSEANGGREGVRQLQQGDVDVVLLDVQMPDLNGREVLRAARQAGVHSEVVVMTAYPQLETAMECLRAGVFDLLEKPVAPKTLIATLGHAVDRGRLQRTTALYHASAAIFSARNPEDLPHSIVETAMKALEADDASLMLPDGTGALTIAYSKGLPAEVRRATRVTLGEGVAGRVAQDQKPALIVGAPSDFPRFAGVRGNPDRVRSSIVFPLATADRHLVGVLNLNRTEGRKPFREADLELASIFASQALLALENVDLVRRLMHNERLAFVGRLAAELSHEVNNPTSFVIANLEYIVEAVAGLPSENELRESAFEALEGARRIARVVQDMRALLRGEERPPTPVDLNGSVRFALRMGSRQLRQVAVHSSLGPGVTVIGDEARLGQVFLNLLTNAVHALSGRPDPRVVISTERVGSLVRATVADNGHGIARCDQGRIFDAFFTTSPAGMGSGLGLSISREIVERHGGELSVESEEGQGTRFTVTLPAASSAG